MAEITQRMNADEVGKNLWVGGLPTDFGAVAENFDALVLAARDHQDIFPSSKHPEVKLILAPLDDEPYAPNPPSEDQKDIALRAAQKVYQLNKEGKKVLVTCLAGVNRSALIAGLSMVLAGMPAAQVITQIRKRRKPPTGNTPLFNRYFAEYLHEVEEKVSKEDDQ